MTKTPGIPTDVEQILDDMDLERMEMDRLTSDLFPARKKFGPKVKKKIKGDTKYQKWSSREREQL